MLFAWAREIADAETRGQLVGVLASADEYVNQITRIAGTSGGNDRSIGVTRGRSVIHESRGTPAVLQAQERPKFPRRRRIDQYDPAELDAVVRWVAGTEPGLQLDDLVNRVFRELGFKRRGRQIVAGIRGAVERVVAAG